MQTLLDNPVLHQHSIDATSYWSSVSMIDLLWQNSAISSYSGYHGNNIPLCPPQKCSCLYCTCRMTAFTNKVLPNCDVCNSISQYHYVTYRQARRAKCMPTQSLSARENTITDISRDSQRFCYPQPSRSTSEGYVCSKSIDCSHTTYPNVNTTSPLSHLSCPSPSNTPSYADLHSHTPQQYPIPAHGGDYCYPSTSPLSICNSSCSLDSSSLRHSPAATPNPPPFSSSQLALAPISCSQLNVPERPGKGFVGEDCKEIWKESSTSPKEGDYKITA